jgi:8-oxo-dGTP pyrophosphatase MutT (NUDIX family)
LSSGGIIFRSGPSEPEILLIVPRGRKRYTLPKGTVERGESLEETALREVFEETGVTARILVPLDPIEYWFFSREGGRAVRVHKVVAYFLMEGLGSQGDPPAHDEVERVEWVALSRAYQEIPFLTEREVIAQAERLWKTFHPSDFPLPSS